VDTGVPRSFLGLELDAHMLHHTRDVPGNAAASNPEAARPVLKAAGEGMRRFPVDTERVVLVDGSNLGFYFERAATAAAKVLLVTHLHELAQAKRTCFVVAHEPNLSFASPIFPAIHSAAERSVEEAPLPEIAGTTVGTTWRELRAKHLPGSAGLPPNLVWMYLPRGKDMGDFALNHALAALDIYADPSTKLVMCTQDRRLLSSCATLYPTSRVSVCFKYSQLGHLAADR
jgi:hypothetical protein